MKRYITTFFIAALYLIPGLLCLFLPQQWSQFFSLALGWMALLSGLIFSVHTFSKKRILDGVAALVCFLIAFVSLRFYKEAPSVIALVFGIYLVCNALVFLIQFFLSPFSIKRLIPGACYLLAGLLIAFFHKNDGTLVQDLIGVYLILQAAQVLWEAFCFSNPYDARYFSFSCWAVLPSFIISFLPSLIYGYIKDQRLKGDFTHFDAKKNDQPVNLRVWIHTGTYGTTLYGHMTFSRNNLMYSYGDYDTAKEHLFRTLGPGILFTVNAQEYINNCCIYENCPCFEYGLHVSKEQLKKFDAMSAQIFENTKPWNCPLEAEYKKTGQMDFAKYEKDYASRLWYRTRAKFRIYTQGEWKWYTILGNNCSNYASAKLNEIGLNLPISHAVLSPGEFFEVMETMYDDPDSCVVSKSWHSAAIKSTLFQTKS
jgi:uncharacterized membrane protein HdeD (DUF308 family)